MLWNGVTGVRVEPNVNAWHTSTFTFIQTHLLKTLKIWEPPHSNCRKTRMCFFYKNVWYFIEPESLCNNPPENALFLIQSQRSPNAVSPHHWLIRYIHSRYNFIISSCEIPKTIMEFGGLGQEGRMEFFAQNYSFYNIFNHYTFNGLVDQR